MEIQSDPTGKVKYEMNYIKFNSAIGVVLEIDIRNGGEAGPRGARWAPQVRGEIGQA